MGVEVSDVTGERRDQVAPFAVAIFLSSALLFLVEPIAAKRILPLLGGSAAVWTACLVFFQSTLLVGYLLAHWTATRLSVGRQRQLHFALVVAAIAQLLYAIVAAPAADVARPITSVLAMLTLLIGVPFVALSASGPLLQSWYARSTTASPYWLYVVSNVGSLLGLVVYPWLIEPRATLHTQFVALLLGMLVFAAAIMAVPRIAGAQSDVPVIEPMSAAERIPIGDRVLWVCLAATGSLLLSAVTSYISQNVATIPLLWIIPLVAYLASFIVAFSDERWHPRTIVAELGVLGLSAIAYRLYQGDLHTSVPRTVLIHCGGLFAICLFCHSELHRRRPSPARLTSFYFHLAAGGALGAILVGVVAPRVLTGDYDLPIALTIVACLAIVATWSLGSFARVLAISLAVLMVGLVHREVDLDGNASIHRERNFYGTLNVDETQNRTLGATMRTLQHGIIEHGQQVFREDLVAVPTTYYGRQTGVGLAIELCCGTRPRRIGVIGLGTGTLAAFGRPGDVIRFYDINPAVEPIARRYFRYLRDSKATVDVVEGDARVSLAAEPPQRFDVIAVDAFSGDAIPVHLITSEALDVYRRHLAPGGVIAFHVSNRYLALAPVVKQLADHAGMTAIDISSGDDDAHVVFSAEWVLVTRNDPLIAALKLSSDNEAITVPPGLRRWTDDYNSLLPILRVR